MAKLPNFIEKERSLWKTVSFVFRESIKGSRVYSWRRYMAAAITAVLVFIEFGAMAIIINEFATQGISGARISVIVGGFILLALSDFLPAIASSLHNYFWDVQNDDLARHLQSIEFLKMHELDIGTMEQPEFQNSLENINSRGWNSFYSVINTITNSIRNIVSLVVASISLIFISPPALIIIFLGSLPTYFLTKKNAKLSGELWKDNAEKYRMWRAKVSPVFGKNSLIELKNFNLVKIFLNKFLDLIGSFHVKTKDLKKTGLKNDIVTRIILTVAFGGAFIFLIHGVFIGVIAIGSLVFSFSVVSRFQMSINQLFDNFGKLSEHKKNIDTFMDFLEMEPLIVSGTKKFDPSIPVRIELQNVSFAYPGSDRQVLTDISLSFGKGDNVAIVGLNGAGKTTLIKLLTRVYDPTSGQILINDIPLREYDLKSWKESMGILLQEYALYSEESVAENIMLGDTSKHNQSMVQRVAEETTIHEFIETLPQKYNQRVGTEFKGGVELSKGQKQKVALARVLYRNAPIVILDEPTASVDALSEDVIFKNLRAHEGQARIIISHKFSNVRDADQIILIQDGGILEQGNHDELIRKNGEYAKLFRLQAEGYKD